jgi:uncharacterized protein
MTRFFADTFYWAAILNPRDDRYGRVREFNRSHPDLYLVTTDAVLLELLNFFSSGGAKLRLGAVEMYRKILTSSRIEVVQCNSDLLELGLDLYEHRPDKEYSLTDCISMIVLQQKGITQVLTHDKHFTQEGFTILFVDS